MQKRWNGLKKCVTLHKYIYLKWEETVIEVKSKEMQKRRQLFLLYVSVARDQKRPFVCSFYFQAAPLFVSALFAFVTISYLLVLFLYSCFFLSCLSHSLSFFLVRFVSYCWCPCYPFAMRTAIHVIMFGVTIQTSWFTYTHNWHSQNQAKLTLAFCQPRCAHKKLSIRTLHKSVISSVRILIESCFTSVTFVFDEYKMKQMGKKFSCKEKMLLHIAFIVASNYVFIY